MTYTHIHKHLFMCTYTGLGSHQIEASVSYIICTHTYICKYIHICVCASVYIYMCVYICTGLGTQQSEANLSYTYA